MNHNIAKKNGNGKAGRYLRRNGNDKWGAKKFQGAAPANPPIRRIVVVPNADSRASPVRSNRIKNKMIELANATVTDRMMKAVLAEIRASRAGMAME